MCSIFVEMMESYEGDLTDIIRASSGGAYNNTTTCSSSSQAATNNNHFSHHHYFSSDPINFSSLMEGCTNFGDPFSNMRDPILYELDIMPTSSGNNSSPYFNNNSTTTTPSSASTATTVFGHKIVQDGSIIRSSRPNNTKNIFSNMIQISPNETKYNSTSRIAIQPSAVVSGNMVINATKDFLVDSTGVVQISSPRNPGLKRRKNQAKRVVCIPAPAAANSRQSGEVVPSDLWAWRKYGQKPIKGSPYPRGYYRCSSSKGCSARKQVERSRTDPNTLVITYTSEHNHPWPTQRNALAGSSRSQQQPSKNTNNNIEASHKGITITKPKEEQHEMIEMKEIEKHLLEMDGDGELSDGISYKACMLENNVTSHNSNSNQYHEEFFAELGEIEADDSLNLLFTQGFNDHKESKDLDPFHLFDWFEEPKRRL